MGLGRVVLVGHDWGGSLARDWAARHPGRVRGVAFMETIIKPMAWADFAPAAQDRFRAMRTPGIGEKIVLEQNASLEVGLAGAVMTGLGEKDHEVYRQPFPTPESRRPLLKWPRAMTLDGEPTDVVARVEAYDRWLAASTVASLVLGVVSYAAMQSNARTMQSNARTIEQLQTDTNDNLCNQQEYEGGATCEGGDGNG
jgi:haloalkane dehalogenase